jgi:hypothetical protein
MSDNSAPVRVSERDRDYIRRLGEYKRLAHEDMRAWHLALSINERLSRSLAFVRRNRPVVKHNRGAGSTELLYERADALGLRTRD